MGKIDGTEFGEFLTSFFKDPRMGKKHYRMGQEFLNKYRDVVIPGEADPKLYYEENDSIAYMYIMDNYVESVRDDEGDFDESSFCSV